MGSDPKSLRHAPGDLGSDPMFAEPPFRYPPVDLSSASRFIWIRIFWRALIM
jgi:hypothetical protein